MPPIVIFATKKNILFIFTVASCIFYNFMGIYIFIPNNLLFHVKIKAELYLLNKEDLLSYL